MPVYEYRCTACARTVERLLPHDRAARPAPCDACGREVRRRFSRVGVRLDGWGFSSTDALVADRPGRAPFRTLAERAERIAETGGD